jgi:2-succinyl-6-hydroxy-2,4-cyclohexadiene-1-carboxylate synthase
MPQYSVSNGCNHDQMTQLWCLHGNLQQPTAWESTLTSLWQNPDIQIIPVDLWSTAAHDFWDWTEGFCDRVSSTPSAQNIILGYSLGGRLALHAVLHRPELWKGAIVVSAHPGLPRHQDRQRCLRSDHQWGQRFLIEPWQTLLKAWDCLPVFNGIACTLERQEQNFSRAQIAKLFDRFSKGRQHDLRPRLQTLTSPPILYVSGALDRHYSQIGSQLAQDCEAVEWMAIAEAGHRVPWENPTAFTHAVSVFLESR